MLACLSRYTRRVAISNSRLIAFDETGVTFRYKDYRRDDTDRQQVMTLPTDEFIRRFLIHVLPRGFHRIRHYGLLAGSARKTSLARARELLDVAVQPTLAISTNRRPFDRRVHAAATHDRHRDVRTLEAAAWTAARIGNKPGDHSMTRHDLSQHHAAGAPLPAMDPRASMVTVAAEMVATRAS